MCRIALLQMASHGTDQLANPAKAAVFCRVAAVIGAGIARFPKPARSRRTNGAPG